MIHNTVTWMHLRSGNRENISSVRRSARSVFCARRLLWTVWKSIISLIRALHWLSRNHHCERQRPKALFFNSQCRPTFSNVFPSDTSSPFCGLISLLGFKYVLYSRKKYCAIKYNNYNGITWNSHKCIQKFDFLNYFLIHNV